MIATIEKSICLNSGTDTLATSGWKWVDLVLCWQYFNDSKGVVHPSGIEDEGSDGWVVLFELWVELSQHMCSMWLDIIADVC